MTIWRVDKHYFGHDNYPTYLVTPYDFVGYMKYFLKRYGLKGVYLFKNQANNKARRLNRTVQRKRKKCNGN